MATLFMMAVVLRHAIAGDFDQGMTTYNNGDYAAVLSKLRPLAEQGDAIAQNNLGLIYAIGHGVPMDGALTYMWLNIAATASHQNALNDRNRMQKRLTPEQIAEGQRLTRQCIKDLRRCP